MKFTTRFTKLLSLLAFIGLGSVQQAQADAVEASTAASPKWYRIYTPNRSNLTLTSYGPGAKMIGTADATTPYPGNMLWRFETATSGGYYIISMSGEYIDPATTSAINSSNSAFCPVTYTPSKTWTLTETSTSGLYTIACGSIQLHQGEAGSSYYVINWGGGSNTTDSGCQFKFEAVTLTDLEAAKAEAYALLNAGTSEGTNPGQYPTAARTTFKSAIDAATTVDEVKTAQETYKATMQTVTSGSTYYIVSSLSKAYCEGKYIYSTGNSSQPKFGDKQISPAYAWTFVDAGDGKYYVQNYGTKEYIEPNSSATTGATTTSATASTKYTIKSLGYGAFNIIPDNKNPLHAQNDNSVLVMWAGELGSASSWRLEQISNTDLETPASIGSVTVSPGSQTLAPGNTNQVLLTGSMTAIGFTGDVTAKSLTIDFGSTSTNAAADLKNLKVYTTTESDYVGEKFKNATLVGTLASFTGTTATIPLDNGGLTMTFQTKKFFVTADVADDATVGNAVDASLASIAYNDSESCTVNSNPEGVAYIYTVQSMPFKPYDSGSHYWRIPAMIVLKNQTGANASKNGRIVTMADMRFNHNSDLPNHIDVYETHSDDNGKTWTDKQLVAGSESDHQLVNVGNNGFGDVALVETAKGKLIGIMVAGAYYFGSTPEKPNIPFIITSTDGGDTWTTPQSLYDVLYNSTYSQGQVQGSFAGSGRGIVLQRQKDESLNGRIMFAMSHRFPTGNIQEYIIYSDDEGATWQMSPNSAFDGGDESKLVELADGTVMISVRRSGQRGYNTSTDGGMTWGAQGTWSDISGNACNADILYYNKYALFHTYINNGSRKNVTLCVSLDNGKTWTRKRTICLPSSCYSTLDVLPDGNIAMLYEDAAYSTGYILNYLSIPTSWFIDANPPKTAYKKLVETARTLVQASSYTDIKTSTIGQYSQASLDAISNLLPTDDEIENIADYEAATDALNAAIAEAAASLVTVDGYPNTQLFTIKSYETISTPSAQQYISASAKAETANDETAAKWQFVATENGGQAYIKQDGAENYLYRSGNTLATTTSPKVWSIEKGSGDYYHFKSIHYSTQSYLVISTSDGSFNFWNNTSGTSAWSTKFILTAAGEATGIDGISATTDKSGAVKYYDLSGRRVIAPKHGVFLTSAGKKVIL